MSFNAVSWKILNLYFKKNPTFLVHHHLESYNEFYGMGLSQILREKNPIHFFKNQERITIEEEVPHIRIFDADIPLIINLYTKNGESFGLVEKWYGEPEELYRRLKEKDEDAQWAKTLEIVILS